MIKPPGDFGRARIFEIDDGVLVAVKLILVEQGASAVDQAGENKIHIAANALAVEAGEQGSRRCTIETFVVIKNPNAQ